MAARMERDGVGVESEKRWIRRRKPLSCAGAEKRGSRMRLTDFKALTFDCYGTLIDWETGMMRGLSGLAAKSGRNLARDRILEAHARHESAQQRQTPAKRYSEILSIVYKRLA